MLKKENTEQAMMLGDKCCGKKKIDKNRVAIGKEEAEA